MTRAYQLRALTPTEATVQNAVLRFLGVHPRVAWAHRFNTGAHVVRHQHRDGTASSRFIRYAFPGCSDILGQLVDGRFLAVECKRPGEYPTAAQKAFLGRVRDNGGVAILARSIDDVRRILDLSTP